MTDKTDGTVDPSKEIKAWKAYFEYAAEDMRGESPELLVACAHRLLEMSQVKRKGRNTKSDDSDAGA
ncbi:hypothetical protein LC092_06250 [Stappia stellulata]|uniref:hypothetical protein n=1 Tax=Stappia TaxID=152161 RepID=UPI001CD5F61F|nr:hypothetical protein [Stappia stellulata]MCA1242031.1 hypothetical protein [Stappia stellulata]